MTQSMPSKSTCGAIYFGSYDILSAVETGSLVDPQEGKLVSNSKLEDKAPFFKVAKGASFAEKV